MALSDEIKERLDIVEVVSTYVPALKRAGRNYSAPCPFHTERTPSFFVVPERQSWRCFGACATGGDILSFVMRMEKLDFSETLKLLAGRVGINISRTSRSPDRRDPIYQLNEAASSLFQETLASQTGTAARTYLTQRGVNPEMIDRFHLGLSPGTGTALLDQLATRGYSQGDVVSAGLATAMEDAPARDMFRGRLMFPIHDDSGNLAGFGGRSLDGSDPKYLNSPRTRVFDKSRILYAFHIARRQIREEGVGVVVEGYMDVIAAHQHGFTNVVAAMGTALTEQQVTLLRSAGRRFVLALDPDTAGQAATFRSLIESWQSLETNLVGTRRGISMYSRASNVSLSIAALPEGKDPDLLIREDPANWRQAVSEAEPLVDFLFSSSSSRWDLATSEGKASAAQELYPLIATMENAFEQERYFQKLADALKVPRNTLEASLGKPRPTSRGGRRGGMTTAQISASAFEDEYHNPLEEHLLALLLQWPELKEQVAALTPDLLERWENRELFTRWLKCSTIEGLRDEIEDNLQPQLDRLLTLSLPPLDLPQREQAVKDCSNRLEERNLRNMKAEESLLLDQGEPLEAQERLEQRVVDTNEKLRLLFEQRSQQQNG